MSLKLEQIEHLERYFRTYSSTPWKIKSKSRRWLKQQRNRKIRRTNKEEKPNIKYDGWEY